MTDHVQTLVTFLQTDLYRLDTALEEQAWSEEIANRLKEHLVRLTHLVGLVMNRTFEPSLVPDSIEDALDALHTLTQQLLSVLSSLPKNHLDNLVIDRYDRNLTVVGHLYDYARLSAMLVEWSHHLTPAPTVEAWFEE